MVGFTFAVEFAFLLLFAIIEVQVTQGVAFLNLAWYVLISLFMAGFYIVSATRIFLALYKRLKTASATGSEQSSPGGNLSKREQDGRNKLMDVTRKISGASAALLGIFILAVLTFSPFYMIPNTHPGYFAFWFVLHTVVNLKALATILSFQPPRRSTGRTTMSHRSNDSELSPRSLRDDPKSESLSAVST